MAYYQINKEEEVCANACLLENLDDQASMSHFLGFLNNHNIRKPFFKDIGLLQKFNNDEFKAKDYVREKMTLTFCYYEGGFVYFLKDTEKNVYHLFSSSPFLKDDEKQERDSLLSKLNQKYHSLINDLFTIGVNEYNKFSEDLKNARKKLMENDGTSTKEEMGMYFHIVKSNISVHKQLDVNKFDFLPKLKEFVESNDFMLLKNEIKDSRITFYDFMKSKGQITIASFLNTTI